jgi:chitin synthase
MLMLLLPLVKFSSWYSSTSTSLSSSCVLSCTRPLESSNFRSMGNRPQGSKFAYTATAIFFALLMGYMLFCSAWLTVKGIQATLASLAADGEKFGQSFHETVSAIAGNRIFRDLIISTAATYGLYLVSSILFFDFLHMFTSFVQYLLLSPSYVNIL